MRQAARLGPADSELLGLPFELGFQRSFSRFVSGGPDRFVIFDLVLDHRVKDDGVLVCRGRCFSFRSLAVTRPARCSIGTSGSTRCW